MFSSVFFSNGLCQTLEARIIAHNSNGVRVMENEHFTRLTGGSLLSHAGQNTTVSESGREQQYKHERLKTSHKRKTDIQPVQCAPPAQSPPPSFPAKPVPSQPPSSFSLLPRWRCPKGQRFRCYEEGDFAEQ